MIIKGRLEPEGIPVKIETESIGRMDGITLNSLGGAKSFGFKRKSSETTERFK